MPLTDLCHRPLGGPGRYHCVAGGPEATVHRLAWSPDRRKWFGTGLAAKRIFHIGSAMKGANGPIAQLDRVTDFYSVGCRFESCWDRQRFQTLTCSALVKFVLRAVTKKAL